MLEVRLERMSYADIRAALRKSSAPMKRGWYFNGEPLAHYVSALGAALCGMQGAMETLWSVHKHVGVIAQCTECQRFVREEVSQELALLEIAEASPTADFEEQRVLELTRVEK